MLNMFRGGPVDGVVYSTAMLLSPEGLRVPIHQYMWTPQEVRSADGRVAQVWVYTQGQMPGNVAPVAIPATQPKSSTRNGVRRMSENVAEQTEAVEPTPAPEPVNTSDLRPMREALKASRPVVAKEAGITVAQLYRIETGGTRTTAEEADKVRSALQRLQQFAEERAAEEARQAETAAAAAPVENTENGAADPS